MKNIALLLSLLVIGSIEANPTDIIIHNDTRMPMLYTFQAYNVNPATGTYSIEGSEQLNSQSFISINPKITPTIIVQMPNSDWIHIPLNRQIINLSMVLEEYNKQQYSLQNGFISMPVPYQEIDNDKENIKNGVDSLEDSFNEFSLRNTDYQEAENFILSKWY